MPRCRLHLDGRKKELLDSDVFIASQLVSGLSYQHTTDDKNIFIDSVPARSSLVGCGVILHSDKGTNIADQHEAPSILLP